ncbi:septum formation initiator family protein [Kitasatospora mediocidica]|uniref:septum formation initiator family protein n=1 Tax=Kitasatospora mediocidica TaxID=58352 RepID=UPI0007C806EF|nr:septum formation initiator family protein [Kitasatospora mediocidica]
MPVPAASDGIQEGGRLPGQPGRARITVRPGRPPKGSGRGRAPFAILMVLLLTLGLLGLLMLNTALNEGSFELTKLQKQTQQLTDQQQNLQQQIGQNSAPDALERNARQLGMVPGGDPAFLQDDGKVLGSPSQAVDSPPVKRTGADLWPSTAQPAPSSSQSATPVAAAPPAAAPPVPDPVATGEGSLRVDPVSPSPAAPAPANPSGAAAR